MNSKTLSNFHKFGKVGKIAMTVLMVIAILATAVSCVAAIYVATLPKDALTVRVTNNAEFRINEKNFDFLFTFRICIFTFCSRIKENVIIVICIWFISLKKT